MNRICIIGRLCRDVDTRTTQTGITVVNFTLAVDRSFKDSSGERQTDFIPVVAWKKLAENCAAYLSKGKLASVDGRLQIRSYEDKDGNKRTIAEVVADDVRFLSPADGAKEAKKAIEDDAPWESKNEPDLPY